MAKRKQTKKTFRLSDEWQEFRQKLIKERKCCACCGRTTKLTIHHIKEGLAYKDYTDISDENQFYVLCDACHKFLHAALTLIKNKRKRVIHPALEAFVYHFVFDDREAGPSEGEDASTIGEKVLGR